MTICVRMTATITVLLFALTIVGFYRTDVFASRKEVRDRATDERVLNLINGARARGAKCGGRYYKPVRPVAWNEALGQASLRHSVLMASRGRLFHTSDYSGRTGEWLSGSGYNWRAYGENVGEGYSTPEEVVTGWLKSPDHCRNIMDPVFKEAGSSFALGSGRIYWTLILATPGRWPLVER
jgi:uncharacterized protein YkwD